MPNNYEMDRYDRWEESLYDRWVERMEEQDQEEEEKEEEKGEEEKGEEEKGEEQTKQEEKEDRECKEDKEDQKRHVQRYKAEKAKNGHMRKKFSPLIEHVLKNAASGYVPLFATSCLADEITLDTVLSEEDVLKDLFEEEKNAMGEMRTWFSPAKFVKLFSAEDHRKVCRVIRTISDYDISLKEALNENGDFDEHFIEMFIRSFRKEINEIECWELAEKEVIAEKKEFEENRGQKRVREEEQEKELTEKELSDTWEKTTWTSIGELSEPYETNLTGYNVQLQTPLGAPLVGRVIEDTDHPRKKCAITVQPADTDVKLSPINVHLSYVKCVLLNGLLVTFKNRGYQERATYGYVEEDPGKFGDGDQRLLIRWIKCVKRGGIDFIQQQKSRVNRRDIIAIIESQSELMYPAFWVA